ncbi:MAG: Rieske 2Fe-2S domain-containing protein [Deltaproteobacteria bacterium]|nr:Rieske 2Fe-2S domain-containing protein [Deltaproteobacteria bacterium]
MFYFCPMNARFFTPPIPNGWFQVAYSDEIKPGDVKSLKYFGDDLVVWRSEDGELSVLDAFCPHLGAHLGHGGQVKGNSIECPFHAWQFGTDGKCTAVPYAEHVPRKARLPKWRTQEVANMVMVWHHAEGEPPNFEIPDEIAEWGSKAGVRNEEWTEFTERQWTIRTSNQEMAENAVDTAHFHYLHGTTNMPKSEASAEGAILRVRSDAGMETPRGTVEGSIESLNYGFGLAIVRFKGIVETLNVATMTPIDADHIHLRFNFCVKQTAGAEMARGVGKAFVAEVTRQLEQDIPIWENKVQYEKPLLCDGDGPIGIFRRWCTQFYCWPDKRQAAE